MLTGIVREREIGVDPDIYNQWLAGEGGLIQNVFSSISNSDREFILTGTTDEEWEGAFGFETDEEWEGVFRFEIND